MAVAKIAFMLPVIAAILYGVSYAIIDRLFHTVSIPTMMVSWAVFNMVFAFALAWALKDTINFSFIKDKPSLMLYGICIFTSGIASVCTYIAIKYVSATYASVGEIAYPIFTALFVFLFFGINQLNLWTVLGGGMILGGSAILVLGEKLFGQG